MVSRILIIDDDVRFRGIVNRILGQEEDFIVVGEGGDGETAVEFVRKLAPDVVLMDIAMPRLDGLQATRRIKAEWPETRVIALTAHTEEAYRKAARESGADAFVSKEQLLRGLLGTIRSVVKEPPGETNPPPMTTPDV